MKKLLLNLFLVICFKCLSQDTLPKFTAIVLSEDKARISWMNPFENCVQISVQRYYDSLNFFQTIFSSLSPELPQNGFVDKNYFKDMKIYYRISYVLDDGKFFFSRSKQAIKIINNNIENDTKENEAKFKQPKIDTLRITERDSIVIAPNANMQLINIPNPEALPNKKIYTIYKRSTDSLYDVINEYKYQRFKDSISYKTKDTLYVLDNEIVIWKPYIPLPLWKQSQNIFTTNKGYVLVKLPDVLNHKYKVVFFDQDRKELFRIKNPKQEKLMLEKSNFLHEGWFYFELFEDEKILEKNKFYIERDF